MFGSNAFPTSPKKSGMGSMSSASPMSSSAPSTGLAAKIAECEKKISDLEQRVSALEGGEQGEGPDGAMSDDGGDY